MDTTDEPVHPAVLKMLDAVDAIKEMLAENRARRDMVASLPAERQEQESQRLARDREQILVLGNILQGLVAAMIETMREKSYDAIASKLREAVHIVKGMLAEYCKQTDLVAGLPPEHRQEESQKLERDFERIKALVKITGGITHEIIEGQRGAAEEPPIDE